MRSRSGATARTLCSLVPSWILLPPIFQVHLFHSNRSAPPSTSSGYVSAPHKHPSDTARPRGRQPLQIAHLSYDQAGRMFRSSPHHSLSAAIPKRFHDPNQHETRLALEPRRLECIWDRVHRVWYIGAGAERKQRMERIKESRARASKLVLRQRRVAGATKRARGKSLCEIVDHLPVFCFFDGCCCCFFGWAPFPRLSPA